MIQGTFLLCSISALPCPALLSASSGSLRADALSADHDSRLFKDIPPSSYQYQILGLNLLRLLALNRIAEFHTELELIPLDKHDNIYIKHPIQLEQYIMEGSYNKVFSAAKDLPAPSYSFFIEYLMDTRLKYVYMDVLCLHGLTAREWTETKLPSAAKSPMPTCHYQLAKSSLISSLKKILSPMRSRYVSVLFWMSPH